MNDKPMPIFPLPKKGESMTVTYHNKIMQKQELIEIGIAVFGKGKKQGWIANMCRATGISRSTVNAWLMGKTKVPSIIAWMLRVIHSYGIKI